MKKISFLMACFFLTAAVYAQSSKNIPLLPPNTETGLSVMKSLSVRYSERSFDSTDLKIQDLSNLLWATNGINRAESGKRTAPSSMNSQDVDVYVCIKSGLYFYNAAKNELEFLVSGDHRATVASRQADMAIAPVFILLPIFRGSNPMFLTLLK